ncbi:hypothetical protein DYB26_001117 [Aphanomyces astaci]|uniref:FYVE-type domain-containing protein n=1 Tax=Aphanomyces astaci TaxID=112090 RepID=A0A397FWB8_APHAT|nr:hypothetical protein DYB31_014444 [Aphanomyces astaci]RHZ39456.1 hypothetical protein DYB26_001117 [Aphanomyces astaci]
MVRNLRNLILHSAGYSQISRRRRTLFRAALVMTTMKKSDVIRLAEGCKWVELRSLIEKDPSAAQERDRFGMIPLHWACTDPNTPQDVLMLLLKAYPAGARLMNSGKMLPLHIAIKAQASIEWLQALLANYPDAAIALTPAKEDVVALAKKYRLPSISINLLEEMRDHVQKTSGYRSGSHTTDEDAEDFDDGNRSDSILITTTSSRFDARSYSTASSSARPYESFSSEQHHSLHMTPTEIDDPVPNTWTNAPTCHICASKFGTFKKRHHCRNCGQSICTDHSAKHKMKLPHVGLTTRQRVCVLCHDKITNAPAAALVRPHMHSTDTATTSTTSAINLFPSQRAYPPMPASSRSLMRPVVMTTTQPSLPSYGYQPVAPQRSASYGSKTNNSHLFNPQNAHKDSVIQDMNLQVQLLQQQVTKLMEEKQQAEEALLVTRRQTSSSDDNAPQSEQFRSVHSDVVRPSWEEPHFPNIPDDPPPPPPPVAVLPRETSLTDHDLLRDTYARNTYDDAGVRVYSRFTLDDRDTFFDKYVAPLAARPLQQQQVLQELAEIEDDIERTSIADHVGQHEQPQEQVAAEVSPEDETDDDIQEVDTLLTLGVAMLQQGCASGAVAAFERAVELMPLDPLLHSYLGKACYEDEDMDRAIAAIERSLDLEASAANWTLLGKMLFEKGDHDKAIDAYQRSLEMQKRVGA